MLKINLRAGIAVASAFLAVPVAGGVANAAGTATTTGSPPPTVSTPAHPSTKVPVPHRSSGEVRGLIVQYRPGAKRAAGETVPGSSHVSAAALATGTSIRGDLTTVRLDHPLDLSSARLAAQQLAGDPRVAFAEPDLPVTAAGLPSDVMTGQSLSAPNDPMLQYQWPLTGAYGIRESGSTGGWSRSSGAGVVVAVLDTGITSHPDLAGRTVPGYDMVTDPSVSHDGNGRDADPSDPGDWTASEPSSWHGTHVAGTIAAATDNGTGVAGTAPLAKIEPVRVLGSGGGSVSDVVAGMYWAAGQYVSGTPTNANPAKVINMSLGGFGPCPASEQAAINAVTAAGVTVTVAAGNQGDDASYYNPANCNNVVTVAATGPEGYTSWYSNYGAAVDLAAPGGDTRNYGSSGAVLSTLNSGTTTPAAPTYGYLEGTSMATPQVAGAVAQLLSVQPGLTPAQVEARLRSSARVLAQCSVSDCGAGLLDVSALVPAVDPIGQKRATPAMAFLGAAVGGRVLYPDGQSQAYQYGTIYYSSVSGAHEVHGALLSEYTRMRGPIGVLGYPTTDETSTPDGIGRYNHFSQAGVIYWTATTGAHEVHGSIRATWAATGWERGVLGYPTTDETSTPDGIGRYNHFSKAGSIYWSPASGSHEIHGAIRASWAKLGWERSRLGYPTSNELVVAGGRRETFQHGYLTWSAATGAVRATYT